MKFKEIKYSELNSKAKEMYNFQKLSAKLADYGFTTMWLNNDWQGADFIAVHVDGVTDIKVQLKTRLHVNRKYEGKEIYMAFPVDKCWYLIDHDELLKIVGVHTVWLDSSAWKNTDAYDSGSPSKALKTAIEEYRL